MFTLQYTTSSTKTILKDWSIYTKVFLQYLSATKKKMPTYLCGVLHINTKEVYILKPTWGQGKVISALYNYIDYFITIWVTAESCNTEPEVVSLKVMAN